MKSGERVHIDKPCGADWDQMRPDGGARFCKQCKAPVVDFTTQSLEDITLFFTDQANRNVCGRYHVRHTTEASRSMRLLNRFEAFVKHTPFRRAAIWLVSLSVLMSSCWVRMGRSRPSQMTKSKAPTQNLTGAARSK